MKILILVMAVSSLVGCVVNPYQHSHRASLNADYESLRKESREEVDSYSAEVISFLKSGSEDAAIEKAKAVVANSLKDPESAKFRSVRVVRYETPAMFIRGQGVPARRGVVICGEVNGKNSYGGYAGFKPFVAGIGRAMIERSGSRYADINQAVNAGLVETCN